MAAPWTLRVRTADLGLTDPIDVNQLTLVENYNLPDTLVLDGRLARVQPALVTGSGIVVFDETGALRFSGFLSRVERNGDGTAALVYKGDLARLWDRWCWPVPANAWSTAGQNVGYDVRTGSAETRMLEYINYNAGPLARIERRVGLTVPASGGRGSSAKTSARFQNVGVLATRLAESASLRLQVVQNFAGPSLDVVVTAVPDMSSYIRFGTPGASGPALLGEGSKYVIEDPTGTVILSAAGGNLQDRILNTIQDTGREALWNRRIELFQDQRGTTDSTEIAAGMADALAEAAGLTEIAVEVISTPDFTIGVDVPIGAKATAVIDGLVLVERIRQITTIKGAQTSTSALFGSQDAGLTATQRQISAALRRVSAQERN